MATTAGSRCAGHGGQLGHVAAGARADLVLLRRDTPTFWPLNDPIRQLVFGATSRDVRTVIVDGRVVVEDGEVVGVDMARLLDDAAGHAAAERDVVGAKTGELESAVRRMFDAAEATPHPVSAYVGR
jgi:guanine deaminase